ncbi:DUF7521 family protein [Halorussus caseinilyticus]|uniref:Uncharacterized protein n=1 Tax=Halorussus caseinilyticus TaxID=3034025 RepID=A0ABD5WKI8_9EURY|nr:hypothetical protein [Halorussus sp. DT72]
MTALQLAPADIPNWVRILSQILSIATALVGLLIAYQAYRGYRRNDSRPMLFIAIGFTLTVGLPFVMVIPALVLSQSAFAATAIALLSDLSTLVGLGCILYALRMPG